MKEQFAINQRIEKLIAGRDERGEAYDGEDRELLRRYAGSGGLAKAGAKGRGILFEFYTPDYLAEFMWQLARHHGFPEGGRVLEPAVGMGRMIAHGPKSARITAFETNPVSARIAEILHPGLRVHRGNFETAFMQKPKMRDRMQKGLTWLEDYPFDLVIGNPPFGQFRNRFSSFFGRPRLPSTEVFFLIWGLKLLRPGGLLIYIFPSGFLRNGNKYNPQKKIIAGMASLKYALRLPSVFRWTKVPVDLLVFQKHK